MLGDIKRLPHYSFESENGKKLKELEKSKTSDDRLVEKIVAEVKEGIELLKEELVKFLSDAKPDNDCLYPTCRIFTAILGASGKNAKELVTSLLERKKQKKHGNFLIIKLFPLIIWMTHLTLASICNFYR